MESLTKRTKQKYNQIEDVNDFIRKRTLRDQRRKYISLVVIISIILMFMFYFLTKTYCIQRIENKHEVHAKRQLKAQYKFSNENKERCANVLYLSSDNYFPCTVVAIYSLKFWANTNIPIVLMASEDVSSELLDQLIKEFQIRIEYVDYIKNPNTKKISKRLANNYTKWKVWELNYEKIIYFDSDFLMLRNEDDLCTIKHPFASTINYSSSSSIQDWVDHEYFNAGFFVANTSTETLNQMIEESKSFESPTGGDQPFLNLYWKNNWIKLNKLTEGANANIFDQKNQLWDAEKVRSFHMTSHLNPCIQNHSPQIFRDLVAQIQAGTLDKNHPLSLWFKAKDELLFHFPSFESSFRKAEADNFCSLFI